ncbi:hypothetical protein KQI84_05160 [bacterium]|nr:hypothetical protein [bacterium]
MIYLTIDGMSSGTGIRDSVTSEYLEPEALHLSDAVRGRLEHWLGEYRELHMRNYADAGERDRLDEEGLAIARIIKGEIPGSKVNYFSDAKCTTTWNVEST